MTDIEIIDHCPWCGAGDLPPHQRLKIHYRDWECGSFRRGIEPVQDPNCKLIEMERAVQTMARLLREWLDEHCDVISPTLVEQTEHTLRQMDE